MNDKVKHFIVGALAAFVASMLWVLIARLTGAVRAQDAWLVAILGAAIAGATKEVADWLDNRIQPGMHGVEFWDVAATAAGGVALALPLRLVFF